MEIGLSPACDEPRFVATRVEPPLLVAKHLEAANKRRQLAIFEQPAPPGVRVALEIRPCGMGHDEEAARSERRSQRGEECVDASAQSPSDSSFFPASGTNSGDPTLSTPKWPMISCAFGETTKSAKALAPAAFTFGHLAGFTSMT